MTTEESTFKLKDGTELYTKEWKPETKVEAYMVFIHGFSDHCNAYGDLFPTLAARGISVFSFDQRGWGRSVHSAPEKGLTGPTSLVISDIDEVLVPRIQIAKDANTRIFLMGHSMGGGEILTYAAEGAHRDDIAGYLTESPLISLHPKAKPSAIVAALGKLAGKLMPKRQLVQKLDPKLMSRDPEVCKAFADDKLCHDTGTLEGLRGMLDRADNLEHGKVRIAKGKSVWISHGTADLVCWFNASKSFADWYKSKGGADWTFKEYDGWYHKLHAEPGEDKAIFAKDVGDWIIARKEAPTEAAGAQEQAKL